MQVSYGIIIAYLGSYAIAIMFGINFCIQKCNTGECCKSLSKCLFYVVTCLSLLSLFGWMLGMAVYCLTLVVAKHYDIYWGAMSLMLTNLCINDFEVLEPLFIGVLTG